MYIMYVIYICRLYIRIYKYGALMPPKGDFFRCYGVIPGATSQSFFGCVMFIGMCGPHGAQRQRCALKLAQCLATWVRVFFF